MSDQDNNSGTGDLTPLSDEMIRRCLLGAALPGEQSSFEERLLVDDEFERRVRLAELELADDFSFERLDAEDRLQLRRIAVQLLPERLLQESRCLGSRVRLYSCRTIRWPGW